MKIEEKHKHKFYLVLVAVAAYVLGWGVWNNYRPTIIYAGCGDIANKTSNLTKRTNLPNDNFNYDQVFNECVYEATK